MTSRSLRVVHWSCTPAGALLRHYRVIRDGTFAFRAVSTTIYVDRNGRLNEAAIRSQPLQEAAFLFGA